MLPNGHVYGYNALVSMAADNNGKIICPATKDEFDLDDAEKVFVMQLPISLPCNDETLPD